MAERHGGGKLLTFCQLKYTKPREELRQEMWLFSSYLQRCFSSVQATWNVKAAISPHKSVTFHMFHLWTNKTLGEDLDIKYNSHSLLVAYPSLVPLTTIQVTSHPGTGHPHPWMCNCWSNSTEPLLLKWTEPTNQPSQLAFTESKLQLSPTAWGLRGCWALEDIGKVDFMLT